MERTLEAPLAAGVDDETLVFAYRDGDASAFEELVRRYQRPVFAIALRFARDRDDAADVAQRAFVNAMLKAASWRGGSFRGWLFRIVVNLGKNHVRDVARGAGRAGGTEPAVDPDELPAGAETGADAATEARERGELRARVREAIARLPRRQREVVTMRVDGELAFAEIGDALGITEANAKVNYHYGVKRLKELLAA
jgi:RNA polymerase sigma-70 factor (ECF subfamily)